MAVQGKDVVLELLVDSVYYPILCATDCSFSRSVEFISTTSAGSGQSREFKPRKREWAMSVSGLTKCTNGVALSFFYILQNSVSGVQKSVRMTFTDSAGDTKQITGNVYFGQMDINGPATDFATSTIELKGTGAYTIEELDDPIPAEIDIISDYWQTVDGQNYISGDSAGESNSSPVAYTPFSMISTDEIIEVDVEGTQFDLVSGTPAAGTRECRFTTSPVRITFPADLIFNGTQRVHVVIKRIV